tara:strand:+ start:80 stop:250 length:171 start_codon:yes stop_codon:yes gene_type:complete
MLVTENIMEKLKESVGENPMRQQCPHCRDYRMQKYEAKTKIAICYRCKGKCKLREQ